MNSSFAGNFLDEILGSSKFRESVLRISEIGKNEGFNAALSATISELNFGNSPASTKRNLFEGRHDLCVKVFDGIVTPISPLKKNDILISNSISNLNIEQSINRLSDEIRQQQIVTIFDMLKTHTYAIQILEEKDKALFNLIEIVSEARHSTTSNVLDLTSRALEGVASSLWAVPGINVLFGAAAYGGSTICKWYNQISQQNVIRESFAVSRAMFFENVVSNMLEEKMDHLLKNEASWEEKKYKFSDWLLEKNQNMYDTEKTFKLNALFHGFTYVGLKKGKNVLIIFAPIRMIHGNSEIIVIFMDLKKGRRLISKRSLPYASTRIESYLRDLINTYGKMFKSVTEFEIKGREAYTATDSLIKSRLSRVNLSFIEYLPDDPSDAMILLRAFLLSGGE